MASGHFPSRRTHPHPSPRPTSAPPLGLAPGTPNLRFLDQGVLTAAGSFGRDVRRRDVDVTTLVRPRIIDYQRQEWRDL